MASSVASDFVTEVKARWRLTPKKGPERDPAPKGWRQWLKTLFHKYVAHPFAERHEQFWAWVWSIDLTSAPDPHVDIWPRGGGKSTSAELATVAVGVRGARRYGWYVRQTQELADKSVENVATLLESESIGWHYPSHAERAVSKYGQSRGWRRNRLRTAGGFTVDALGLDTAARGLKVEEQRPDWIVLDDIDDKHDSPATTAKKIALITTSILPAGASNAAVLAIQNLIIPDGVFTRLADGRADFLVNRVVSGPHPAIIGLETEWVSDDEAEGARRAVITAGEATWEGQDLDTCQQLMDRMGLSAFLKECQHEVTGRAEGLALRYVEKDHLETLSDEACQELVSKASRSAHTFSVFGGVDPGSWRFAFTLRVADRQGVVHQLAEFFSQRQSLEFRARAIHTLCAHYGCPPGFPIWADAANPTDIMELNLALQRIESPYRIVAVLQENKLREPSVERMNDLLDRGALRYRRNVQHYVAAILSKALKKPVGDFLTWQLGMNASGSGQRMEGSRLLWEVEHWKFPIPKEGEAQVQDPDDDTADGADEIAAERYAIMSWWGATSGDSAKEDRGDDRHPGFEQHGKTLRLRSRKHVVTGPDGSTEEADDLRPGHYSVPRTAGSLWKMPRWGADTSEEE